MSQTTTLAEGIYVALSSNNKKDIEEFKGKITKKDVKQIIVYLLKHHVTNSEGFIFTFFDQCIRLDYNDWVDILKMVDANLEKDRIFSMEAFLYISYVWIGINLFIEYAKIGDGINKKVRKYFLRLFGYSTGLLCRSDYDKKVMLNDYGLELDNLNEITNKLILQGAIRAIPIENNQVSFSSQENPPKGWEWVKDYPVKKGK